MWTHSTFGRARGARQMFRSLLGPWLGTATGKKNRSTVGLRGESPTLAVRLGAQRGLLALHLVATEIAVDRRRPPFPSHHRLALTATSALDTLCFDRHFYPLPDRHAGIIGNLRDGCQVPPFSSWDVCGEPGGGWCAERTTPMQEGMLATTFSRVTVSRSPQRTHVMRFCLTTISPPLGPSRKYYRKPA